MAQRTLISLTDDLDGSVADHTIQFGLNGKVYEIDLNSAHLAELEEALLPYIAAGRKVSTSKTRLRRSSSTATASGPSSTELREWAKANGISIGDRGRVPYEVRQAYLAALS